MKKLSLNILFYLTIFEAFFLIFFLPFSLISHFAVFDAATYVIIQVFLLFLLLEILSWYFFGFSIFNLYLNLYQAIKVHHFKKMYSYTELMDMLTEQRKTIDSEQSDCNEASLQIDANEKNGAEACQEQELLQKYFPLYVWFRNPNCQMFLHAFTGSTLLILFIVFIYDSFFLVLLTAGLFFFGFVKFFKGNLEVA